MQTFPATETTILFQGAAGKIEMLLTPADESRPQRPATAIICHPHPLYGGTMTNKVVTTLARTFREAGLRTVRFNFRGVGKSEGVHDEGHGETDDVLLIIAWIKKLFPHDEIWLAGFSFGGFVAANAASQSSVARLFCVAPWALRFKTAQMKPITCPWVVIQGEKDEVVPPEEVYEWVDTLDPKPRLIRIAEAGHYFHGKLMELRRVLEGLL